MILGPADTRAVAPLAKVAAALPVAAIGDVTQELQSRAYQFLIGHEYQAKVLGRLDEHTVQVSIENTIFQMNLGQDIKPGQSLTLRFMHQQPNPTFILSSTLPPSEYADKTKLSAAGYLIDHYLHEASSASTGSSSKAQITQTNTALTMSPQNPYLLANDLKQSVSMSGLFYESHLAQYAEGKRSLATIMQEPQNRINFDPSTLVAKQLDIFESNKLQWNGQVWPGQTMQWSLNLNPQQFNRRGQDQNRDSASPTADSFSQNISSELKLDLPNIGRVAARLQMQNGRLRIQIEAEDAHVAQQLKQQSVALAAAIQTHGKLLDQLSVKQHAYLD